MQDAAGQSIFRRDMVRLITSPAAPNGMVLRCKPPKAVVLLPDGTKVTADAGDVLLADRSYLCPGMTVVSASADDTGDQQLGVVTGTDVELDLVRWSSSSSPDVGVGEDESTTTTSAAGVSPAALRRVRELCVGDYVVSGHWLGRVFEVSLDVDVIFDDGEGVCRVVGAESKLWPVNGRGSLNPWTNTVLYPGQHVGGGSSVFRNSRWLTGHWKPSRSTGTVSKVETASVLVYWVASSSLGSDTSLVQAAAPAHQQSPRDLTFFAAGDRLGFWGLGDRCFFRRPSNASDVVGDASATPAGQHGQMKRSARRRRNRLLRRTQQRRRVELERPMLVTGTRTTVDVLWQDGTRWRRVPSASLLYSARQNIHEFFPGQRVVYRPGGGDENEGGGAETTTTTRVGVVTSLNFKDQTVRVSWPDREADKTALVSTYDLGRSFDSNHNVFYGDFVVRRSTSPTTTDDDDGTAASSRTEGADDGDVSWVGHVVDFCDDDTERVQVKWGDGNTSEVPFHEIAVVKGQSTVELLREIGKWTYQEDGDEGMNSAPPPAAAVARAQETNIAHVEEEGHGEEDNNDDGRGATRMDLVGFVIQTVFRLGAKMLAKAPRHLPLSGSTAPDAMPEEITAMESTTPGSGRDGHGNETSTAESGINGVSAGGDGSTTSGEGKVDAEATVIDDKSARFPLFEIVQSPPDHHYIDNIEPGTGGGRTSKWTKRVQKEWKILENDLPDTIYVRAFEDRMDLLRVAMVGASGTPYHDGLFFFDLQLPPSYPAAPPLVSYRSFGLRVNPNLYASGTVCLSLLNTFGGRGSELWSPDASSLLQVVVSIQGLVLNAQPYYNESNHAVQAGTPEGRRNELPYSENAYLLTLQTMLHLLRQPPAGFEGLVRDHFVCRGHRVLRACRAYVVEGCPVGTLDGDGCPAVEGSRERPCTMGFRLALTNVVPRLVEAFTAIGAQGCQGFDRLQVPLC